MTPPPTTRLKIKISLEDLDACLMDYYNTKTYTEHSETDWAKLFQERLNQVGTQALAHYLTFYCPR